MPRYEITPRTWHRMTQHSKHSKEARAYHQWKMDCQKLGLSIPNSGASIVFHIPMPKSWAQKKRKLMVGSAHMQKPDLSNLLKAVEDAARYGQEKGDQTIWSYQRLVKLWAVDGAIEIVEVA